MMSAKASSPFIPSLSLSFLLYLDLRGDLLPLEEPWQILYLPALPSFFPGRQSGAGNRDGIKNITIVNSFNKPLSASCNQRLPCVPGRLPNIHWTDGETGF